ncbi:hypothetical protein MD484_g2416, partial [Candolleomyces efflorescens]
MKFSALLSIFAMLLGLTLVMAYPLPSDGDSDLELRGEFLDVDSEVDNIWARAFDDYLEEVFERDLMDADSEEILEARILGGLKYAWSNLKTDVLKKGLNLGRQAYNQYLKPRPTGPSPFQKATAAIQGRKRK